MAKALRDLKYGKLIMEIVKFPTYLVICRKEPIGKLRVNERSGCWSPLHHHLYPSLGRKMFERFVQAVSAGTQMQCKKKKSADTPQNKLL